MALDYAILSINWSKDVDLQNTKDLIGFSQADNQHRDDLSVTPFTLSRYFLYNRDLPTNTQNGRSINDYIRYRGGFITAGDKVNSKYSNFTTNNTITVYLTSNFHSGINMLGSNRIYHLRRIGTIDQLISETRDNEALTIGDFKRYSYHKGMIMMWSGTYETLQNNLPYWRLCAPPHSGNTINNVLVPNLQGKFIMGGYPRNGSTPRVGDLGGSNRVQLTISNLPTHAHSYNIQLAGAVGSLSTAEGGALTFYTGGGDIIDGNNIQGHADDGRSGRTRGTTISGVTRLPYNFTTITIPTQPNVAFIRPSSIAPNTEDRGGNQSHENRPPFYALAYIIYVGSD